MKLLSLKLLLSLLLSFFFVRTVFAQALINNPIPYEISADGFPAYIVPFGTTFYTKELDIPYQAGKVYLSAFGQANGNTLVNDTLILTVTKPDGTQGIFRHSYDNHCGPGDTLPPTDLTYLFAPGINHVKAEFVSICTGGTGATPMYIVTEAILAPIGFLDLPWDYSSKGMDFNEAATSITTFFDHEYPLLSLGQNLAEPTEAQKTVINLFGGGRNNNIGYSKHDGYDYAKLAKVNFKDPVIAAAAGKAYYKTYFPGLFSRCDPCGNMIVIDHGNGYMTRYLHLDDASFLLVNKDNPGPVQVSAGQLIGHVGHTGHTDPTDERGAHIHFDVVEDKNHDGDFEDNIPDGITDPFGWQSKDPDPWENYSFKIGDTQKTGNKSYYLFTKKLDNLNASLTPNGGVFNIGKTTVTFPQGTTNQNLKLTMRSAPSFENSSLSSLGSTLLIEARNSLDEIVHTFITGFIMVTDFSQYDLNRYRPNTITIYTSVDAQTWQKEDTQVDLVNKTATANINHLTYFALMAERKDAIAPTTTAILEGAKGSDNNFRSDVKVTFSAVDNPDGLGVEYTAYSLNDSDWQTYTTPLTFTSEGNYKIQFYSEDKDGNIEDTKTVQFSIDKNPPEAKIEVDQTNWNLKISPVASDSAQVSKVSGQNNKATYILKDLAGNTLSLDTYDLDTQYIDIFKLNSLKYNSAPAIPIADNTLDTNYIFFTPKKRPEIQIINQNFNLKDKATFVIVADVVKNKTILDILENRKLRKETKLGVVLLKLQTNKGKLEYSY